MLMKMQNNTVFGFMKINIFAFVLLLTVSTTTYSQSWKDALGKVFGNVAESAADNTGVLGNVLGSLIGNAVPLSERQLVGTWNFEGAACVLESENALSNIGGAVAAEKIEEKLDNYLGKLGVAKGSCSFTFQDNDSCVFSIKNRNLRGTYKLNAEEKKIDFSFLYGRFNVKTHVAYQVTDMNIVFDADKLMSLLQKTLSAVSALKTSYSTTLKTITTLAESYDGMMIGMKLKKR